MSSFVSIQEDFQNYLLNGNPSIFHHIAEPPSSSKETRLDIYYTGYRLRLQEALASDYSGLRSVMGDDDFYTLCNDYIQNHPSSFRSIRWFGDQIPHFLRNYRFTQDKPYLAELADFEWTSTLVFDAADSPILTVDDLINIAPETWGFLRFHAHPSLHRLQTMWNIIPIWTHLNDQTTPPELACSSTPTTWVLWRKNLSNHYISLSEIEAAALNVLLIHEPFGTLCQELCHWFPEDEVSLQAASFLKSWILKGFFRSFSLD